MKHKNTKDFLPHTMVTFFLRTVVRTTVQMFVLVRSLVPVYRYDVPVLQSLISPQGSHMLPSHVEGEVGLDMIHDLGIDLCQI